MSERRPLNNTYADGQVISPSDLLKAPYNILYLINKIFNKKMINFNKSAAKRLAIWKPMSKPYVDSRFHFTTELYRVLNILNTNKIVNNQAVKNIIDTKLKKCYYY